MKNISDIFSENKIYFHSVIWETDETIVASYLNAEEFNVLLARLQCPENRDLDELLEALENEWCFVPIWESVINISDSY